jgi:polyisoprenoid-binding protein YceI
MTDAAGARTVDGKAVPAAGTYTIDPTHSMVEFSVRHLGLAKVRGRFTDVAGTITVGENVEDSSVEATIQAASIDTRESDRDTHLRSPDFLDVEQFPTLEFQSTGVQGAGSTWSVEGNLSIHGVTRPVTLDVEFEGTAKDPWGNTRVGFSGNTEITRDDYGLTWNQPLETGGWLVGKQVKIEISAECVSA